MTIFRLKQPSSHPRSIGGGVIRWDYDRAELIADSLKLYGKQSSLELEKDAADGEPVQASLGDRHDVALAREFFPRLVGMRGGKLRFDRIGIRLTW